MRQDASRTHRRDRLAFLCVYAAALFAQSQPPPPTPAKPTQYNKGETIGKKNITSTDKSSTDSISTAIDKFTSEIAPREKQTNSGPKERDSSSEWWLKASTIISAVATFFIAILAGVQAWLMHRQRVAMERQTDFMRNGLELTKEATAAATESAQAAALSATTAKRSVELLERADVAIETIKIDTPEFNAIATGTVISIILVNHGRTRAERVTASVLVYIADELRRPIVDPAPTIPFAIPPAGSRELFLGQAIQWLKVTDFGRIAQGEAPYIKVKVDYRDVFGNDRWTETGGVFAPPAGWMIREHNSN